MKLQTKNKIWIGLYQLNKINKELSKVVLRYENNISPAYIITLLAFPLKSTLQQ